MKKTLLTFIALLFSATMVFAFGTPEEETVEVAGTIDAVGEDEDIYTLDIVSEDGERAWTVEISAAEFERFNLSEGEEINLTAVRTASDRLEVNTLVVGEEEFEVDRTELLRDDETIELETDG